MNIKRYYYTFDNSLLFTESIQNATDLSTLNHNVRFLPIVSTGALAQYCAITAKPCVHRF